MTMTKTRLVLYGVLGVLVIFLLCWLSGSSGRRAAESRLRSAELRLNLTHAQAALSSARVDLFELNFGQATRRLDEGRRALEQAAGQVREDGPEAVAEPVREAIGRTTVAHQLAGQMDQAAGSRAADALRSLDSAMALLPPG